MNHLNEFDQMSTEKQKIIETIKNEPVPVVSQTEINAVCKVASSYYVEKQNVLHTGFWKVVIFCCSVEAVFYWLLLSFMLGNCVVVSLLSTENGIDPIAALTALIPVPIIAFAIRELQYRDDNLVQIEKTCKYAPEKIYFARLWLGVILNTAFILAAGTIVFSRYENMIQLYLCSFIAMFFVGAITLLIMSLSDSTLPLSLCMLAWVLGSIFTLSGSEYIRMAAQVNPWYLAVIMLFTVWMFAFATVHITRKLYA